jgi:hypothetical protein
MKKNNRRANLKRVCVSLLPLIFAISWMLILDACSNVNENESIYPRDFREGLVVLDSCPKADQQNISTEGVIRLLFNKDLDPSTVHGGSVVLGSGRMYVRGNVFYDDRVVTYIPTTAFVPNSLYVVYLTTSLRDADGFALSDRIEVLSFKTGEPGVYTCR